MKLMECIVALAMLAYTRLGRERSVPTPNLLKSYDFIIVGGGTAGSIVASKLSENPNIKVLLLESGGSSSEYSDIPYTYLYNYPDLTKEALHCFGADQPNSGACWRSEGNFCQICASRILGGGSSLNGFTYVRGTRLDYDNWASNSLPGWSYDDLLLSMMALENFDRPSSTRGSSGPVHVTEENCDFFNLTSTWLDAGLELGYPINPDYNGRNQIGFGRLQNNLYKGARQTMDNVFLQDQQKQRPNLHIKMFAHVTRVIFDDLKRATGVEVAFNDDFQNKVRINVEKEIVLSAGAIQTPLILIRSGIGPLEQVNFAREKLVVELDGVGRNLQDHPSLHMVQFQPDWDKLRPRFDHIEPQSEDYDTWLANRTGPLATGSGSGLAFFKTNYSTSYDDAPIEIAISGQMQTKIMLNAAKSRGRVMLPYPDNTTQSFDGLDPYVQLNLLDHPDDIENLMEGARIMQNIFQTDAFKKLGAKPSYVHPPCNHTVLFSEEYFRCLVKDATVSGFHYAGTAKMANSTDPERVVDERLKVYEVQGLRVADASIMPTIVRSNPNVAVMLIGWKAAEMIKADHNI